MPSPIYHHGLTPARFVRCAASTASNWRARPSHAERQRRWYLTGFLVPEGGARHDQALRETLRMLLRSKFGDLDAQHEQRIDHASTDDLQRCVQRFVAAQSVDDVLASS
jgi:hypothetical protein